MSRQAILDKLSEMMCDILDDDDIVLTDATSAADVHGWDSLANVRFMLGVEKAFKVRFAAAEFARLTNVGGLVDLIESRT
ncbi:MAG: acyl carrier protein [Janthinobacterium lividum]